VDLVVLHATVRDRTNDIVSDLRVEHFEVFEDGVRQSIKMFLNEDLPVTVGLVVDHSGSMRPKLNEVTAAARAFVRSSNPDDEMFVVNFNEDVRLGLRPAIPFTNQADELELAIAGSPTIGKTALYDAIGKALKHLEKGRHDKKVLVVFSDGGDNASSLTLEQVGNLARTSSALIYTVGIFDEHQPDRNPGVLRRLSKASGGEAYFPAGNAALASACKRIAHEIRNQYTIGYHCSGSSQTSAFRRIRVTAKASGRGRLTVQTRSGYFPNGGSP
jgi:VWFA-related protein